MTTTLKLQMTFLESNQQQAQVPINDALMRIDEVTHCQVINQTTTAPPASPANGDAYLIDATSPTGAWALRYRQFAFFYNGWTIITPWEGFIFTDLSDTTGAGSTIGKMYVFTAAPVTGSSAGTLKSWNLT